MPQVAHWLCRPSRLLVQGLPIREHVLFELHLTAAAVPVVSEWASPFLKWVDLTHLGTNYTRIIWNAWICFDLGCFKAEVWESTSNQSPQRKSLGFCCFSIGWRRWRLPGPEVPCSSERQHLLQNFMIKAFSILRLRLRPTYLGCFCIFMLAMPTNIYIYIYVSI